VVTELTKHITDSMVFESFKSFSAIEFMKPQDVAASILYALTQESRVDINEILLRSTEQAT